MKPLTEQDRIAMRVAAAVRNNPRLPPERLASETGCTIDEARKALGR